jgi:alpha-D-xyloside xylohydrolase
VLKANTTKRDVYLPAAPAWYDFWTGKLLKGSQDIEADAPLERMPLFVRAGSIVPIGPQIEYAAQDPAGPIELRIYRGADGEFDLYEDAGDGYEYEKGEHSIIRCFWNDRNSSLTIGAREGSFPGIVEDRRFRVVLVADGRGVGADVTGAANAEVRYKGKEVKTTIK